MLHWAFVAADGVGGLLAGLVLSSVVVEVSTALGFGDPEGGGGVSLPLTCQTPEPVARSPH